MSSKTVLVYIVGSSPNILIYSVVVVCKFVVVDLSSQGFQSLANGEENDI